MCASRGLSLGCTGKETQAENESFIMCLAKRPSKAIGAVFFVIDEIDLFLQGDNAVVQFLTSMACLASNHIKVCTLATVDPVHCAPLKAQLCCLTEHWHVFSYTQ